MCADTGGMLCEGGLLAVSRPQGGPASDLSSWSHPGWPCEWRRRCEVAALVSMWVWKQNAGVGCGKLPRDSGDVSGAPC